ncbi:MAG: ABC transporter substrate-binding protein [Anaerolineales bacterium]
MAHDVFVSYSTKDKTISDTIVASLEQNQIRCWYAPRDIQASEDWGKAITNGILKSKVFLIIFSGNANQSQRVLDELNFAISKEIIILPFRIENLEPDGAMGLHLSSRHWLDAYDPSWESHIEKLIKNVSVILETSIDEQQIVIPAHIEKKYKQQPKKLTRIMAWIAVGMFLITAGWYGWSLLNNRDNENPELSVIDTSPLQESLAVQAPGTATATSTIPGSDDSGDGEAELAEVHDSAFIQDLCSSDTYGCAKIEPGQTIKIGISGPMTGENSSFGIDAKQSGLLAITDSVDLYGFSFELISKDDAGSASGGATVAKELIADPTVVGIAGHTFSESSEVAMPFYEDAGIPMFSPSASNPDLLEQSTMVYNQLVYTDKVEGFATSNYIFDTLGFQKIAILHSDHIFCKELANHVNTAFEAFGGEVVAFGKISSNETENQLLLTDIAAGQPELLYYCGFSQHGAMIVELMKSNRLEDVVFFGCSGIYGNEFLNSTSENAGEFYLATLREPRESDAKENFDATYLNTYGISPGILTSYSWNYYDSTMALISKVKDISVLGEDSALYIPRGALVTAVRNLENYVGISGTYTCNIMGSCNLEGPQIVKVIDGKYTPVE